MTGKTIGQFEIHEQLGSGGMGVVYRARDSKLDRDVALKFLPPSLSSDEEAKKRFQQEAKAASGLDHPNICTIYDIGESEDGRLFIAMAYYDGTTLKYRMADGDIEQDEALSISRQIAQGLHAAHTAGIVHRDIKPANIMVTSSGRVKILDFGVAKLEEGAELTKMGSTVGTAAYMSPEQATGRDVDVRSDLWSLGIVMYEMLAGGKPFDAGYDQALLYSILNEPPPQIADKATDVPEDVANLVMSLLEKDPAHRAQAAIDISDALSDHAGTGTRTSVTSRSSKPATQPKMGLTKWMVPVAAVLVLVVSGIFFFFADADSAASNISDDTIAIFPFTVNGDESLQYLDDGMISLLGTKLDGTDNLKTVDKTALLGLVKEDGSEVVTPDIASGISSRLLAGSFVLGSVTKLANQIQLDATLYSSADTVRVQVTAGSEEEMPSSLDELAIGLVTSRLSEGGSDQLRSVATMTTEKFEALKAYLEAEKFAADHEMDEAREAYLRAVGADSTFSLAWYRLAKAVRWGGGEFTLGERMAARRDALDKALEYQDKLPYQYRTLIQAADAFEQGDVNRAQDLYRSQLERYPNQIETLLELADLLVSYNPLYGRPASDALPYIDRVLELESDNHEADDLKWALAIQNRDSASVRGFFELDEDDDPDEFRAWPTAFQKVYFDGDLDIGTELDSIESVGARFSLAFSLGFFGRELKAADNILQTIDVDGTSVANRDRARLWRQTIATSRGQVTKADSLGFLIGEDWAEGLVDRVMRSTIPMFDASMDELRELRSQVARWDTTKHGISPTSVNEGHYGEIRALLLGSLAAKMGDDTGLAEQIEFLSGRPDAESPGDASFVFAKTLRAIKAWYDKDDDLVLAELENAQMFTNDVCAVCSRVHAQTINRFMRAEILFAREEYDSALGWYNSLWDGYLNWGSDHLGTTYLRTAAIYEERDDPEMATQYYAKFVDHWKDADPRYQGMVSQARDRLEHLIQGDVGEAGEIIIPVSPSE